MRLWGFEISGGAHALCFQDLNLSVSILVSWPPGHAWHFPCEYLQGLLAGCFQYIFHSLLVHRVEWPRDVWPFSISASSFDGISGTRTRDPRAPLTTKMSRGKGPAFGVEFRLPRVSEASPFWILRCEEETVFQCIHVSGSWIFKGRFKYICLLFYLSTYMMAQQTLFLPILSWFGLGLD